MVVGHIVARVGSSRLVFGPCILCSGLSGLEAIAIQLQVAGIFRLSLVLDGVQAPAAADATMPLESRSLCVYINSSTMHRTVFSLILTSDTLKPCTRDALLIPVWWIIVWAWTSLQQQLVTRRRPGGRALHSWGLQVCMVCGSPVFVVLSLIHI